MVYRRVVTLLSPIECSIDDIGSRIVTMREEMQAGIDRASDTRGLTRLVQGSVLPQVNAEHNILWQGEMERGFSKMMQAMEVYLQEGEGWEDLKASTKNYAP
ncbi:hypothetical protein Esi_0010_0057 [Ectocarpus siliculosus]|uniref:Uncharacterized protein n=1 Tax=Ectocarpus siliculosus TaxID=2880 RepID=D8LBY0_ECTSI|nr:hypothetical protein Esi_0010_0057 [Ectocarpus siliculosus]|eukprot:CBN79163.1 hypothetical protein Esi_0010_0057 [Ectocarpus siliculosus]